MFCTNCGAQVAGSPPKCPQCGTSLGVAAGGAAARPAVSSSADSSALKGFFVLLVSFLSMPVQTLQTTGQQLREIGAAGSVGVDSTALPHLSWLKVAGNVVISIAIVLILLFGVGSGLMSLKMFEYSPKAAIGGLVLGPFLGVLGAIAADWLLGMALEMTYCVVVIANDIRKIANRSG